MTKQKGIIVTSFRKYGKFSKKQVMVILKLYRTICRIRENMFLFPELIDVGIMGHCKHDKLGLCIKAGVTEETACRKRGNDGTLQDGESIKNLQASEGSGNP